MKKKVTITIDNCIECPFCSGSNSIEGKCFHDNNPNGDDCTTIFNVYTIPSWCPLKDADISSILERNKQCDHEVKKILRKHYVEIMTELQELLHIDDIQTIAEIELTYKDNLGNGFKIE